MDPATRRHIYGHLGMSVLYGILGIVGAIFSAKLSSDPDHNSIHITILSFFSGFATAYGFVKCGQETQNIKIEMAIALKESGNQ